MTGSLQNQGRNCWLKDPLVLMDEEKANTKDFKIALYDLDKMIFNSIELG